jgi:Tol biopolymer transport system component
MFIGKRFLAFAAAMTACAAAHRQHEAVTHAKQSFDEDAKRAVNRAFAEHRAADAEHICAEALGQDPHTCQAQYCVLIAKTLRVVDEMNAVLGQRPGVWQMLKAALTAHAFAQAVDEAAQAADATIAGGCEYTVPSVPIRLGAAEDPILDGEIRGVWTPRDAHLLAAIFAALRYDFDGVVAAVKKKVPTESAALPPLLQSLQSHLLAHDKLLFAEPADPAQLRGGWFDRNHDHQPDLGDELLIDIFVPGTDRRVFDFSQAEFVTSTQDPLEPLSAAKHASCGYEKFHIDDVVSSEASAADGMSFSSDGKTVALPLLVKGKLQIHLLTGAARKCLTCGQPGNNDGVRFQPRGDAILFVSDRDHPFAFGSEGAGLGQELYVMRADGSQVTRLTTSHMWATNYHPNWSSDGRHIVWGTTEAHTFDVMEADFISDAQGMRLGPARRLTHDTIWWETHGFSADGREVIATGTRAGFLSPDIYAIDIATHKRRRLTNDLRWDEHAHLSPDGSTLAWISGRFHDAPVSVLNRGTISPLFDFLWIGPGILFEILRPAGYATELTLMNADGTHTRQLTRDDLVVADNEWSSDGTRIIFRQSSPDAAHNKIRVLTFDDCGR